MVVKVKLRKSNVVLLLMIVFVCFIYYYWRQTSSLNGIVAYRMLNKNRNQTLANNQILIYNKYYNIGWKDLFTGEPLFRDNRCIYTTDPDDLMTSEWVLIHHRDIRKFSDLPQQKFLGQKWILYNIESPMGNRRWDDMKLFRNIAPHFDITMNYRLDSDIPIPYGMIAKNANETIASFEIDFQRKTKQIAWFVSNCESFSRREEIVEKLGRHIPIDIYGKCGTLICPTGGDHFFKNEACYQMLSKDYKFYLSFENSLCIDYVTEKLFNILNYDIIPIVYGGVNYSHILPANSYIDVRNFSSSVELASYLNYVGNNEAVYRSYFDWRKDYHVQSDFPNTLCDSILDGNFPHSNRDIFKWWLDDTCEDLTNCCWTE
ncbi:alpha-(1,3)-fucosyltransferase C-like [Bradysia coprophila]|uniref:alpha-(1,3)-fucosyltransferase C-like n=1 Tax=Bradysia coprophila TaxID=38358 RepID=UPI00187DCF4C|nr:alpha-(1,3)-fucosyltransferase C-like [Bradysia coprophila]